MPIHILKRHHLHSVFRPPLRARPDDRSRSLLHHTVVLEEYNCVGVSLQPGEGQQGVIVLQGSLAEGEGSNGSREDVGQGVVFAQELQDGRRETCHRVGGIKREESVLRANK